MKEADTLKRDESVKKSEVAAEAGPKKTSRPSTAKRPQNPLIPPPNGSADEPGWWRLVAGEPESRGFSVAGDSNSLSAKLTAMLIPVLLAVLILVLLKDYAATADPSNSHRPVAAGFMPETTIENRPDASNPKPAEAVALVIEPPVETEGTLEVEEKAEAADTLTAEIEVTPDVESEVASEAEVISELEVAVETQLEAEKDVAAEKENKPEVVTVGGILYSRDNPSAIIGGRVVHVGDIVSDATIVGITKDRVLFEKPGQRWGRKVQEAVAAP